MGAGVEPVRRQQRGLAATVSTTGMLCRSANPQLLLGEGVVDAAGDDQRLLASPSTAAARASWPSSVAAGGSHGPPSRRRGRVVVGLGWTSLGRPMKAGPHVAGSSIVAPRVKVWTTCSGLTMRSQRRGDGLEGVVHRDRRVAEALDLLEDGIGDAAGKRVARQQQDGRRRLAGRRRPPSPCSSRLPDGARGHHDLPPPHGLGVGDGGEGHPLLVLPPPRRHRP